MKRYGIIGYPLAHSFSKKYFTEKFLQEGLPDCSYDVFPITEIGAMKPLLVQYPDLCGFNVTIPYKQQVLSFLDDVSALPEGLHACNCVKITDGKLKGYNTDIIGFERSLFSYLKPEHDHALVLGSGGAAEAVKFVLRKLKIGYTIVSRKLNEADSITYTQLEEKIIRENLLIINTTPLGTFPDVAACPDIPYTFITPKHILFDLVYNPPKTLFLRKGEERGALIINGYKMLEEQAEESWRIWSSE